MKLSVLCGVAAMAIALTGTAQQGPDVDDKDNLIKNGSFEETNSKPLKKAGMLDLTEGWFAATEAPADIFVEGIKSEKVNVPKNVFGSQDARSGSCYAGFRAYTKDNKKAPRTYIETQLTKSMVKNKTYCIRFNVSLSDLSKYGVNYIGAYISPRKFVQPNAGEMVKDLHVKKGANDIISDREGWTTVCGTYVAKGGESHIIIGCFERNDKIEAKRMKKPSGFASEQQRQEAYYYLDDILVKQIKAQSECGCEGSLKTDIIYGTTVNITEETTAAEAAKEVGVYFSSLKAVIPGESKANLKILAKKLKADTSIRLVVSGNIDDVEQGESEISTRHKNLDTRRAQAVIDFLIGQGIDGNRFTLEALGNSQPASTRTTPLSVAQNRRVTFTVR